MTDYVNKYGLITNTKRGESGNDLMYTAEWLLTRLMWDKTEINILDTISTRYQGNIGQYFRHPDHYSWGHQSIDDLIGIAALHAEYAAEILKFIQSNHGLYPTTPNPNKLFSRSWFKFYVQIFLSRFQGFIAFLKIRSGKRPNWFQRWWLRKLVILKVPKDLDGWRKSYLMV
jgi:hypothetical protein